MAKVKTLNCGEEGPTDRLSDVLEVFAWFEANSSAGWDAYFFAGPGVPADAALPRLDLKDAEAAQLYPFPPLHGGPHRVEYRINGHLGFDLGDVRGLRHLVDDVDLDQWLESPDFV
jgi:hypothetical protein